MTAQQLFDLLTDLQNDGMNLSDIHLAYPSHNTGTVHERIEHTEIVQLPDEITNTKAGVLKGVRPTEIVFMTDDDKKIYTELLNTEFSPVMVASPGEGAVIVEPASCPLKQQSITVKLDQEYQKQKQKEAK